MWNIEFMARKLFKIKECKSMKWKRISTQQLYLQKWATTTKMWWLIIVFRLKFEFFYFSSKYLFNLKRIFFIKKKENIWKRSSASEPTNHIQLNVIILIENNRKVVSEYIFYACNGTIWRICSIFTPFHHFTLIQFRLVRSFIHFTTWNSLSRNTKSSRRTQKFLSSPCWECRMIERLQENQKKKKKTEKKQIKKFKS